MLEYDMIDVSEGIDVKKSDGLCDCFICHYCYFLEINFEFQPEVCNDVMQKTMSVNDGGIACVKGNYYRFHFWYMSKDEVINLSKNADLTEKSGTL